MLKVDLVPTISQRIKTVAKKEYDETVRRLLASGEHNRKLAEMAEVLESFLETADFKKLRSDFKIIEEVKRNGKNRHSQGSKNSRPIYSYCWPFGQQAFGRLRS